MSDPSNNDSSVYLISDKRSPAYTAVKDEWPKVVTAAIDDVHRTGIFSTDDAKANEGKKIVAALANLKYEIQHNRWLTLLPDDGQAGVNDYNADLEASGTRQWFDAPWLFAECYLYRRINTYFALSTHWRAYDVFVRQKLIALRSAWPAICETVLRFYKLSRATDVLGGGQDAQKKKAIFADVCSLCLTPNVNHLNTPSNPPSRDRNVLSSPEIIPTAFSSAYKSIQTSRNGTISFLTSTTPFSLLQTLLFSTYLLKTNLATKINLYAKPFPWNVTEATPSDIKTLLSSIADPESLFQPLQGEFAVSDTALGSENVGPNLQATEREILHSLASQITEDMDSGALVVKADEFWTSPHGFADLPQRAPALWEEVLEAEMVVLVGQEGLGWRKIVGGRKVMGVEDVFDAWKSEGWVGKLLVLGGGEHGGMVRFLDGRDGSL